MRLGKRNVKSGFVISLVFVFILFPTLASAAELFFESTSDKFYQGDVFVVKLKLSSADNSINAFEGNMSFDSSKLEVKEISTGGSIFSLWPTPAVPNDIGQISFVGGVMGGFQGEGAEILKIAFVAKNIGVADINIMKSSVLFLNDGKGTRVDYSARPLELSVLEHPVGLPSKDEWQPLLEQDNTPPESFELMVDKNNYIFEGDYFVSFFTTDTESGVDYYEIREGEVGLFARANSPYKLKDQSLRSVIEVKAVDKAGNERLISMSPLHSESVYQKFWFWSILFILAVLFYLGGKVWRRKRQSSNR